METTSWRHWILGWVWWFIREVLKPRLFLLGKRATADFSEPAWASEELEARLVSSETHMQILLPYVPFCPHQILTCWSDQGGQRFYPTFFFDSPRARLGVFNISLLTRGQRIGPPKCKPNIHGRLLKLRVRYITTFKPIVTEAA